MKFGHDYIEILQKEGFPTDWIHSAISYRQLKKCIKKVRRELLSFGLSPEVLNQLWNSGAQPPVVDDNFPVAGFQYSFLGNPDTAAFVPKLTLIVDPKDGSPVDAFLTPETRRYLKDLKGRSSSDAGTVTSLTESESGDQGDGPALKETSVSSMGEEAIHRVDENMQAVEIPLSSDSEFFRILRGGLKSLQDLQEQQQEALDQQVMVLRRDIVKVANSPFRRTQNTLDAWREIFRLYIDLQIFFSTDEMDSGQRSAADAQQQLEKFQTALVKDNRVRKLKKDGRTALECFMQINSTLLQVLKFQEVNSLALSKILKKFDKQTALRARSALPQFASPESAVAQSVAKAVCRSISDELISVVPQLDDYLCPICMNVAFKPVRLRCGHVFCIRCLVVMQRGQQDQCAMCRREVVLEASSDHLDQKLLSFLSATFPKETKAKQKENERAASLDFYGETYDSCTIM